MKAKRKLIVANILTLLVGGLLLTNFSFAWLQTNKQTGQLKFQTASGTAKIVGYAFKRQIASNNEVYTSILPDLLANQVASTSGSLVYEFDASDDFVYQDVDLLALYNDENGLDVNKLPGIYIELQLFTYVPSSYFKVAMKKASLDSGQPVPSFSNFAYRYQIFNNNPLDPILFATPSPNGVTFLQETGLTNITSGITDYNPSVNNKGIYNQATGRVIDQDSSGQIAITLPPEQEQFYRQHFAKSIVIELTPDPVSFGRFLLANYAQLNTAILIGLELEFDIEYSLNSFGGV